jgi:hypothetical protein
MRNIHNTLWDVLSELELAHILHSRVDYTPPSRYLISIRHPDRESLIEIEMLFEQDGGMITSLLQRRGFSRRITEAILDALVENMDTDSDTETETISSQSLEQ